MNTGEPDLFQVCLRAGFSSPQSWGEWAPVLVKGKGMESIFNRVGKFDIVKTNPIFRLLVMIDRRVAIMGV